MLLFDTDKEAASPGLTVAKLPTCPAGEDEVRLFLEDFCFFTYFCKIEF